MLGVTTGDEVVYFGPSLAGVLRSPAPFGVPSAGPLTPLTRRYSSVRSMTAYELFCSFHLCSHAQDSSNRLDGVKFYRPPLFNGVAFIGKAVVERSVRDQQFT